MRDDFYKLDDASGVRCAEPPKAGHFSYVDQSVVREQLIDFSDERVTRVTFRVPAIH